MHKGNYGMKTPKVRFRYFDKEIHSGMKMVKMKGMKAKKGFNSFRKGAKKFGRLSSQEVKRFI